MANAATLAYMQDKMQEAFGNMSKIQLDFDLTEGDLQDIVADFLSEFFDVLDTGEMRDAVGVLRDALDDSVVSV
jgi:hypothetical protein